MSDLSLSRYERLFLARVLSGTNLTYTVPLACHVIIDSIGVTGGPNVPGGNGPLIVRIAGVNIWQTNGQLIAQQKEASTLQTWVAKGLEAVILDTSDSLNMAFNVSVCGRLIFDIT